MIHFWCTDILIIQFVSPSLKCLDCYTWNTTLWSSNTCSSISTSWETTSWKVNSCGETSSSWNDYEKEKRKNILFFFQQRLFCETDCFQKYLQKRLNVQLTKSPNSDYSVCWWWLVHILEKKLLKETLLETNQTWICLWTLVKTHIWNVACSQIWFCCEEAVLLSCVKVVFLFLAIPTSGVCTASHPPSSHSVLCVLCSSSNYSHVLSTTI